MSWSGRYCREPILTSRVYHYDVGWAATVKHVFVSYTDTDDTGNSVG